MKKTILFVNAGHGGLDDNGNYTTPPHIGKKTLHTDGKHYHGGGWFYEGVFNRDIAGEFICAAKKLGYICIPTYHEIYDTSRMDRIKNANREARGKQAVWISFHANAIQSSTAPQDRARGMSVFVFKTTTETAKNAGQIIKAIEDVYVNWGGTRRPTLVYDKPLDETYHTAMPAMLFEIGFFDNAKDAELLINPKFRAEVIQAMLKEIVKIYE